ncbi:MAG: prenyltransferase/squalene oxidase repeat-containing protein [Planctomycetota bacterium]
MKLLRDIRILFPLLLLAVVPAFALPEEEETLDLRDRVNQAIFQGVSCLRAQEDQLEAGLFEPEYPGGATCLAYYTLLMCGVSPDDPFALRLEQQVVAISREVSHTYTLSLALLGLMSGNREDHGATIALLIARLEAGQFRQENGGAWGYTLPAGHTGETGRQRRHAVAHWAAPDGWWDNSNSQYAILALRAAVDFGYAVDPKVFERAAEHFLEEQKSNGGFGYSSTHRPQPYISMTAGAAGSLAMCADLVAAGASGRSLAHRIRLRLGRAERWLGHHLSFPCADSPWPYYAAYSVERFGHYAQLDSCGQLDWYREGAEWLIAVQAEDGSWSSARSLPRARAGAARGERARKNRVRPQALPAGGSLVDTCFALLFLRRSSFVHTQMSDEVSVLLRGIDSQARRSDLDLIRSRILSTGIRAVPQLVKGLFLPSTPARLLADECLRELTGEDMGFQRASGDEEQRRAREAWVRFLLTHEEYGRIGS